MFSCPVLDTESVPDWTVILCPADTFKLPTAFICVAPLNTMLPVVEAMVTDWLVVFAVSVPPPVTVSPAAPVTVIDPALLVIVPALLNDGELILMLLLSVSVLLDPVTLKLPDDPVLAVSAPVML